jgi:protein-disulfide isomerase
VNTRSERLLIAVNVVLLVLVLALVFGPKGFIGRPLWGTVGRWQANRQAAIHWTELTQGVGRLDRDTGEVALLVFSDFECPACRSAWPSFHAFLMSHPDIGVGYVHLPIPGHVHARPAARAAICADSQGQLREMTVLLFETPALVEKEAWSAAAVQIGLSDTAAFSACLRSPRPDSVLARDAQLAARLAVAGTPTFWTRRGALAGAQSVPDIERQIQASAEENQ